MYPIEIIALQISHLLLVWLLVLYIYIYTFSDILEYLSHNMSVDNLCTVLPVAENSTDTGRDEYQTYVITCQKINQANQIKSMVMVTGQQLLVSLNFK